MSNGLGRKDTPIARAAAEITGLKIVFRSRVPLQLRYALGWRLWSTRQGIGREGADVAVAMR